MSHTSLFQVEPYLQLGSGPSSPDRLALLWHARDGIGDWAVEIQPESGETWTRVAPPVSILVPEPDAGAAPHRVWTATLTPLEPGRLFEYRVLQDGTEVFRAEAKALKAPGQPQQVVVAGDLAGPEGPDAALVREIHRQNPDLMVASGELVPPPDTLARYRRTFFPLYNAGRTDPMDGAPFMRSTVLVRAPGDAGGSVDRLAYRTYWDQPRGGPQPWAGQVHGRPAPADGRLADPGSFAFRSGDVHWTILGSGAARWNDPGRKAWLARELDAAQAARWRFVVFQRPAADGMPGNHDDGGMGTLWPLFRQYHVTIVFTGRARPAQLRQPPAAGPILVAAGAAPSFSRLDVSASRVAFSQIDGHGAALDHFTLSR